MNRRHFLAATAATVLVYPLAAATTEWPSRPVQVVVPFAAGGPTDVQTRLVTEELSARLGEPFIV